MSSPFPRVLASVGLVVAAVACAHEQEPPAGTTTTSNGVVTNYSAVYQIASARCRRAAECNLLGNGSPPANREQCMAAYVDYGAPIEYVRACPSGVDKARLDKCLAQLQWQQCDDPMGQIAGIPYCRSYCVQ